VGPRIGGRRGLRHDDKESIDILRGPLKCVGDRREARSRSRSARQSDVIWVRPNQGGQRLAQTRGYGEEGPVIDDVRAQFCRLG